MFIGLTNKVRYVKFLVNDHSPAILTAVGVGGTVATAYLTGRASFKAARIIDEERGNLSYASGALDPEHDKPLPNDLSKTEKVKLTWKLYLPPVAVGVTTVTSIIAANKISSRRMAALVVASGISERAFQEYKDKVIEKLGDRQDQKIRDEVAQDRVNGNPVNDRQIIITGAGEVLCFDSVSGRYFMSTIEEIKKAENRVNYELIHFMSASLSMFYDEIGLPPTSFSDSVGWNMNNKMEVDFSTTMSSDGRPCIVVDFKHQPVSDYARTAWET